MYHTIATNIFFKKRRIWLNVYIYLLKDGILGFRLHNQNHFKITIKFSKRKICSQVLIITFLFNLFKVIFRTRNADYKSGTTDFIEQHMILNTEILN